MTDRQLAQLQALFDTAEPAALGPEPRAGRKPTAELDRALEQIFVGPQKGSASADAIRALLFLWHDHLDQSHSISQDIHTADGSFIHGIMHRREPDFANAKYWFNRVGRHSAFPLIASRAATLTATPAEQKRLEDISAGGDWDPFAFIDACEQAARRSPAGQPFLQRLQQIEFSVLLQQLAEQT
jgi:hypothetical protein